MRWRISTGLNLPTVGRAGVKKEEEISGVGRRKVAAAVTNRADLDEIPVAVTLAAAHQNVRVDRHPHRLPPHRPPVLIALRRPLRLSLRKRTMGLVRDWTRRYALHLLRNPL
jgi:hypothetical protein